MNENQFDDKYGSFASADSFGYTNVSQNVLHEAQNNWTEIMKTQLQHEEEVKKYAIDSVPLSPYFSREQSQGTPPTPTIINHQASHKPQQLQLQQPNRTKGFTFSQNDPQYSQIEHQVLTEIRAIQYKQQKKTEYEVVLNGVMMTLLLLEELRVVSTFTQEEGCLSKIDKLRKQEYILVPELKLLSQDYHWNSDNKFIMQKQGKLMGKSMVRFVKFDQNLIVQVQNQKKQPLRYEKILIQQKHKCEFEYQVQWLEEQQDKQSLGFRVLMTHTNISHALYFRTYEESRRVRDYILIQGRQKNDFKARLLKIMVVFNKAIVQNKTMIFKQINQLDLFRKIIRVHKPAKEELVTVITKAAPCIIITHPMDQESVKSKKVRPSKSKFIALDMFAQIKPKTTEQQMKTKQPEITQTQYQTVTLTLNENDETTPSNSMLEIHSSADKQQSCMINRSLQPSDMISHTFSSIDSFQKHIKQIKLSKFAMLPLIQDKIIMQTFIKQWFENEKLNTIVDVLSINQIKKQKNAHYDSNPLKEYVLHIQVYENQETTLQFFDVTSNCYVDSLRVGDPILSNSINLQEQLWSQSFVFNSNQNQTQQFILNPKYLKQKIKIKFSQADVHSIKVCRNNETIFNQLFNPFGNKNISISIMKVHVENKQVIDQKNG